MCAVYTNVYMYMPASLDKMCCDCMCVYMCKHVQVSVWAVCCMAKDLCTYKNVHWVYTHVYTTKRFLNIKECR